MRTEQGGNFRKQQDTAVKSKEIHKFLTERADSVGYVEIKGKSLGTGFAVGDKYVMSAYHIFKESIGMYSRWEHM